MKYLQPKKRKKKHYNCDKFIFKILLGCKIRGIYAYNFVFSRIVAHPVVVTNPFRSVTVSHKIITLFFLSHKFLIKTFKNFTRKKKKTS